jgi:hypothetical protein
MKTVLLKLFLSGNDAEGATLVYSIVTDPSDGILHLMLLQG